MWAVQNMRQAHTIHRINTTIARHNVELTKVTLDILSRRPAHHGVPHAMRVAALSQAITPPDLKLYLPTIRICALAHDIGDSKFVDDTDEWDMQLYKVPIRTRMFILDVGRLVSFSRERMLGRGDWLQILGAGVFIRAIVSDADKLDSLGEHGHQRLVEYNHEKLVSRGITARSRAYPKLLCKEIEHVIDTRQRLILQYMQTSVGKSKSREAFMELVARHNIWRRDYLNGHD
jgi:hypothetical protein